MSSEFVPLFKLGRAERLQLVEDLWDSIAQEDGELPVPDWKRDELRRRKERFLDMMSRQSPEALTALGKLLDGMAEEIH